MTTSDLIGIKYSCWVLVHLVYLLGGDYLLPVPGTWLERVPTYCTQVRYCSTYHVPPVVPHTGSYLVLVPTTTTTLLLK